MRSVLALLFTLVAAVQFAPTAAPRFVEDPRGTTTEAPSPDPTDDRFDRGGEDGTPVVLRENHSAPQRTHAPGTSVAPVPVATALPPDRPSALYLAGLPPAVPRVHVTERGARSPPVLP